MAQKKLLGGGSENLHADMNANQPDQTVADAQHPVEVLMVPISDMTEPVGLMAEEKVLQMIRDQEKAVQAPPISDGEKRTRFSLSHDFESVGKNEELFLSFIIGLGTLPLPLCY